MGKSLLRQKDCQRYVYIWPDGVYFGVRLSDERPCVLVLMGATADGRKELLAIHGGERESEQGWREVLLSLRSRGLVEPPKLAIGDGALGFWCALAKIFPGTRQQRCWVHKTANVLDKLPKKEQASAKAHLRTTNPIESSLAMVFKLAQQAEKRWRRLNGHALVEEVIRGTVFVDGTRKKAA